MSALALTAATLATWAPAFPAPGVVDVTPPRSDGALVVAAGGRLSLLRGGALVPFARGAKGYSTATGEPYVALSSGRAVGGAGCRFPRDAVYAVEPSSTPGVIRVSRRGVAKRVASLPTGTFPSGIAFDTAGDFGSRLLVTATAGGKTSVFAIDCRGAARTLTTTAPAVEGGMQVAPRGFGRFGGQLIAPDEQSGRIVAIDAAGAARVVAASGLPVGGDIGVESVGFVPPQPGRTAFALMADRGGQAQPHPGSDALLGVRVRDLLKAGARPGDLLAATEGGATTIAVRCARTCTVRKVADGPSVAHGEGHVVIAPARP